MDKWRYGSKYDSVTRLPKEIEERVRVAMGEVGAVLVAHHIAKVTASDRAPADHSHWRREGTQIRYAYSTGTIPTGVSAAMTRYRELFEELQETYSTLETTKGARAKAIALEGWD